MLVLEGCLREALAKLDNARRRQASCRRASGTIVAYRALTEEVRALVVTASGICARRLNAAERTARNTAIDPARLAQEAALLAERSDIQ